MLSFVPAVTADGSIWSDMLDFQIPPTEKVIRTIVVYVVIAVLIRVFGKRTLAQLNTSDLVVVLLLSNVVQNAIIGDDNSLTGGVLGAVVLMVVDWLLDRVAWFGPRTERLLEGTPTTLIRDGQVDEGAMRRVGLRRAELNAVLHRQGADSASDVSVGLLQPGGSFDIQLRPDDQSATTGELRDAIAQLQLHLDDRLAQLEARLAAGR